MFKCERSSDSPTMLPRRIEAFFPVHQHLNVSSHRWSQHGLNQGQHLTLLHARTHTHTHNYLSLASFWGEWTLNTATSWPPWKPRSSTEKHKEETGNPIQTQWHGNHELMGLCCHILRGCQIFQPWPWDTETSIKSDQSTLSYSAKAIPLSLSVKILKW